MKGLFVAALAAPIAIAVVATSTAAGTGGLSVSPAILESEAARGPVGTIRVTNDSSKPVAIVVRARPWIQSRNGSVRPDAARTLAQIQLGTIAFTLAPGTSRTVSTALTGRPTDGSLYGAVEVVGTPRGPRPANGIRTRYRLLSSLRLNPPKAERKLRVVVGSARAGRDIVLAVRNAGNTVQPITGTARISGPSGTLRSTVVAHRILPRRTVDVRLRRGRLQPGRYTAVVALRQAGRRVASVTRTFRVR